MRTFDLFCRTFVCRLVKYLEDHNVRIKTGQTVEQIEQTRTDGVSLSVAGSKTPHRAEKLIVCIPASAAARIRWTPSLSPLKTFYLHSTPMGYYIKFALIFSNPYWGELGLSGHVVTSLGSKSRMGCEAGPVTIAYTQGWKLKKKEND